MSAGTSSSRRRIVRRPEGPTSTDVGVMPLTALAKPCSGPRKRFCHSVVLDVSGGGVNLGQEAADVLHVPIERQVQGRTHAESIARVRAVQPRVISAPELV